MDNKRKNDNIKCTVSQCEHNMVTENYCSLNCVCIGTHEDNPTVPEGTILASFDGAPSNSMFTAAGDYGDGKSTYEGTYCKKGVKLNSKGSVTFTPQKDYQMTLVLATTKTGRDVTLNGQKTTVGGKENAEGAYYEMEPISIAAGTQYVITKGSAESILMFIKLVPVE